MTSLHLDAEQVCALKLAKPLMWPNPSYQAINAQDQQPDEALLFEAEARLARFAPLLVALFPELEQSRGIIESPLQFAEKLNAEVNPVGGKLLLKLDSHLPVAGSIKARGGIHEVLCLAEQLALEQGLLDNTEDDYLKLASDKAKSLFSKIKLAVGSTGNLGLSIGIIGSALGFDTTVHMSSDAKEWKKQRLTKRGVTVVEYPDDYGAAVAAGRAQAEADDSSYFVDDERSSKLFMGYAVAALRLKKQLSEQSIPVDAEHPLFVYLPAGVGGAPGGICYGLKQCFGEHVHCFFAEPVEAPCMLLGMATPSDLEPVSVYEMGLSINTEADGLAVGQASPWVCQVTRGLLSGVYTAEDSQLYQQLLALHQHEAFDVEPSAAIATLGPQMLATAAGRDYIAKHQLQEKLANSHHIAWLTGGSFVPQVEYQRYLTKARSVA